MSAKSATAGISVTSKPRLLTQMERPELKEGVRELNGVLAEAVGPRTDNRRRATVAWDGRASCPERANRGDEENDRGAGTDRRAYQTRDKPRRPNLAKHQTKRDRTQVSERRTHQTEVCNVRHGSPRTAVVLRITYQAVSLRTA